MNLCLRVHLNEHLDKAFAVLLKEHGSLFDSLQKVGPSTRPVGNDLVYVNRALHIHTRRLWDLYCFYNESVDFSWWNCTFPRWLPFKSPFLFSACPRSVLGLSFYVLQMSSFCPCSVLGLPLSLHKILLMSMPWPFLHRRLLVGVLTG